MVADIRVATNQAPPLVDHNTVTVDAALVEAVTRHACAEVVDDLSPVGALASTASVSKPATRWLRSERSERLETTPGG
jgi:hypothetical protein